MHIYRGKFNLFHYAENEAITVVAPTSFQSGESVYFSWKWTSIPAGCSDTNFFDVGTFAVETTDGKTKAKITFSHDDYYFDAILGYEFKSLFLTLQLKDGRVQDPTALHSVYNHQIGDEMFHTRLFTGKINHRHSKTGLSAVDEMFVVIVPEPMAYLQPLFAFWQWSNTGDDGSTKVNVDCVDRIRSVTETPNITFTHGDDHIFAGEVTEGGQRLTVTLKNSQGEVMSDLLLQKPEPVGSAFSTVTSEVKNDSTEVVYCTLKQADSSGTMDTIFNYGSFVLSLAGLPSVATGLKLVNLVGKWQKYKGLVNGLGYGSSTGGVLAGGMSLKDFLESDSSVVTRTLFPGDSMTRTANDDDNGVQLIRAYVNVESGASSIKIVSIEKAPLGSHTQNVSALIQGGTGITTTDLLQFELPVPATGKKYVRSDHRLTFFPKMKPVYYPTVGQAPELDDFPKVIPQGALYTSKRGVTATIPSALQLHHYVTLKHVITEASREATTAEKVVFNYDADLDVQHNPVVDTVSELLYLKSGRPVLKLKNCTTYVEPAGTGIEPSEEIAGSTNSDERILHLIHDHPKSAGTATASPSYYWAYRKKDNSTLWGIPSQTGVQVRYEAGKYTYLVASSGPFFFRKMATVATTTA